MENNNENVESIKTEEPVNQVHHDVNDNANNARFYDPPEEFNAKHAIDIINKKINFIFTILATAGILFGYYFSPEIMIVLGLVLHTPQWIKHTTQNKVLFATIAVGLYYMCPSLLFIILLRSLSIQFVFN